MSEKAEIRFEFTGNIAAFVKDLKANFNDLNVQVNKVDNTSTTTFQGIKNQLSTISFVSITQGIENFRNTLQSVTGPALSFEQSVADLSAITGIAGGDLEDLSRTSRQVGVSSALGATQAAEAFKLLASQISVDNIGIDGLKLLQKETITLAQASGMDLPTAANSMASAINQFGMEANEASRVINVLAAGAKYGAAEIPQLAETFRISGATANAAGIKIEGLAGVAEVLSKNAITGSEAGTHLRNIIVRMQTQLGMDLSKVPLSDALKSLQPELDNTDFLVKTFGESSIGAVQYLIANADAVGEMTDKVTETNIATEQAAIRTETYSHTLSRVNAWFDNIKISIFNYTGALLPATEVVAGFAQGVSSVVPALRLMGGWINMVRKSKIALAMWTKIVTAAQWLWNVALTANPIGVVIVAIGALVAGILWLTGNLDVAIEWVKSFGNWLLALAGPVGIVVALIIEFWDKIRTFFYNVANSVLSFIESIIPGFKDYFIKFWEWLSGYIKKITDTLVGWWNDIKTFLGFGKDDTIEIEGEVTHKVDEDTTTGGDGSPSAGGGLGQNPISAGIGGVSGSSTGSKVRNNNIRIENLVREITIKHTGDMGLSIDKIREAVSEALIGAVRDTELAIS